MPDHERANTAYVLYELRVSVCVASSRIIVCPGDEAAERVVLCRE